MTRAAKKLLLAAYYLACVVISLACLFVLSLRYFLDPALESQKGAIEEQLELLFAETPSVRVRIGDISFGTNIYRNFLHVEDVSVVDEEAGKELLFAGHAYSELSYLSLFRYLRGDEEVSPVRLAVLNPRLSIDRRRDGNLYFAGLGLGTSGESGVDWKVPLDGIVVENAAISFVDETGEYGAIDVDSINLTVKHELGKIRLALKTTSERYKNASILAEVDSRALLAPDIPGAQVRFEAALPSLRLDSIALDKDVLRIIGTATLGSEEISVDYAAFLSHGKLKADGVTVSVAQGGMQGSVMLPLGGLSGERSVAGRASITLSGVVADMPDAMLRTILADKLGARLDWEGSGRGWRIAASKGAAANKDLSAEFSATVRGAEEIDHIDVGARLRGGTDGTLAPAYLPATAGEPLAAWLDGAIRTGAITGLEMTVRGRPESFPYADGPDGVFRLDLTFQDADIDYWPGWPGISGADGELVFAGKEMRLNLLEGVLEGIDVSGTELSIPDMLVFDELVSVSLQGAASGGDFLSAIAALPPLKGKNVPDNLQLSADAAISSSIEIPIRRAEDIAVDGTVELEDATLRLPGQEFIDGRPFEMSGLRARISFGLDWAEMSGSGRLLGNRAQMRAKFGAERWEASLQTKAEIGEWIAKAQGNGARDIVKGETQVSLRKSSDGPLVLASELLGVEIGLPAPLGKLAVERAPVRLEVGENTFAADYKEGLMRLALVPQGGKTRALIGIGQDPPPAEIEGDIVLRGALDSPDIGPWLKLASVGGQSSPRINAILEASNATLWERTNEYFRVEVSSVGGNTSISVDAEHIAGSVALSRDEAGESVAVANFERIRVGKEQEDESAEEEDAPPENFPQLPRLVLAAEEVRVGKRNFGKVAIEGAPSGSDWVLERLVSESSGNKMMVAGATSMEGAPRTDIRFDMEVADISSFMRDWGVSPDAVNEGNAMIGGSVSWRDSLLNPDARTMDGEADLAVRDARFTQADSGIFKLLQLLTPDVFLSLGFTETLKEGILFKSLDGTFRIEGGVMRTGDVVAKSEDISVEISGQTDLDEELLDFRGKIRPGVAAVNALLGATMLATAPAAPLSAVVGWLAGKILEKPIDAIKEPFSEIGSYEYTVTGTWDEPVYAEVDP